MGKFQAGRKPKVTTTAIALSISISILGSASTLAAVKEKSDLVAASKPATTFSQGENTQVQGIPCAFGPYKARSTQIGVYKARLKVSAEDLKGEPLFLVIRMQEDKTHGFGWVRAYVNNQLVATEAERRESRIVGEATKALRPGESQISIMGAAYPGTSIDYYLVPKDSVLSVLQNKPLGSMLTTAGPYQAAGTGQEKFNDTFNLSDDESKSRMALSIKTLANKTSRFGWIRVSLNGQLVASEQNFNSGEATVDLTGKVVKGANNIEVIGTASPGTPLGWYIMQLPTVTKIASRGPGDAPNLPTITGFSSKEISAGATVEVLGHDFDSDPDNIKILLDDQTIAVKSASKDKIAFVVPSTVVSGTANLSLLINDEPTNSMPVSIIGSPHVGGTSVSECPSGYELIVYGDNFPETTENIKVSFGSEPGTVLASCKRSLLVKVPENLKSLTATKGNDASKEPVPIKVFVGNLESKEKVAIKLGSTVVKTANLSTTIPQLGSDKNATFNEAQLQKLLEQANAANKAGRVESAEYFYLAAIREASKGTTISKSLLDSLAQLAAFYRTQSRETEAKQYEDFAHELSG